MKNYLFAPFRDEEDKIEEFNAVINALNYVVNAEETHYHESALHGLRVFIGRFESYYDVIISDLKSKNAVAIADERVIKELEDKVRDLKSACRLLKEDNDKLRKENSNTYIHVKAKANRLQAELKQVNADYNNDSKVHEEYAEGLLDEIKQLKADACSVNTKHYPKEYKQEAEEYFNHNPHCKKVLFFMIEGDEFEWDEDNDGMNGMNGEYNSTLYADDCIAEIDN